MEMADFTTIRYHALVDSPWPRLRIKGFRIQKNRLKFPLAFFCEHPELERSVFFINRDFLFLTCMCTLRLFGDRCEASVASHGDGSTRRCTHCIKNHIQLLRMCSQAYNPLAFTLMSFARCITGARKEHHSCIASRYIQKRKYRATKSC